MNYPIQWGIPQILLVLAGLAFLCWSFGGLIWPGKDEMISKGRSGRVRTFYMPRGRHINVGPGIIGLVLLSIGVLSLVLGGMLQAYVGLTGKILVAHVHATQVQNAGSIPQMSVDLTLYDQDGKTASSNTYLVKGKELSISGDIIQLKSFLNIFGFHSGYKVTLLEGRYTDSNQKTQVDDITLNGGDDPIFLQAYNNGGESPFATSAYKNGSTIPANRISYNICASNDAIVPQPDDEPC